MKIQLNCDMGESFGIWNMGRDNEIMPFIDMANLACGFHASDAYTMQQSVHLAKKNRVTIGAHPGYQDLVGFGRRSISCSPEEIKSIVLYQLGALSAFCKVSETEFSYVKPHGALYNDMMKDESIFRSILDAIASYDNTLKLMVLSLKENKLYEDIASSYGVSLLYEVFADRNYNDDGTLVPRSESYAVVHYEEEVLKRVQILKNKGYIKSIHGNKLYLQADTICVHGDNENALGFIKLLNKVLRDEN